MSSFCHTWKLCFLLEIYLLQEVLPDVPIYLPPSLQCHSVLEAFCGVPCVPVLRAVLQECLSPVWIPEC